MTVSSWLRLTISLWLLRKAVKAHRLAAAVRWSWSRCGRSPS